MPHLIWTPAALADVQRIYRSLAPENIDAARRAVKTIRSGVKILAHQPHVGRLVEDMDAEYREGLNDFGSSGYIALYRLNGDGISILAVCHQKEAGYQ